jgi:hypothetical protein
MASKKLNLEEYSDEEITAALMKIGPFKFMRVMNSIAAIVQKAERRGKLIAQKMSDGEIDDLISGMFNDKN